MGVESPLGHPSESVDRSVESIPEFPNFKEISLVDRRAVEELLGGFKPYSDFNFTSLWAWDTSNERMISRLNGNLVVRFTDYETRKPFYSFIGKNRIPDTARKLMEHASSLGLPQELLLMPQATVEGLSESVFDISEDRNNFDYIYSVADHASMEGSDFKRSRNFVRRFRGDNPDSRIEFYDLSNPDAQKAIISVMDTWRKNRSARGDEYNPEFEHVSIQRLIETSASHSLLVSIAYSGNQVAGFSIDEVLPDHFAMAHFWKGDSAHAGVYDYLLHEKCKRLKSLDVQYLNMEQDLGVPNLRKSKMAYRPVSFLKKYRLSYTARS